MPAIPGFAHIGLTDDLLAHLLDEHAAVRRPRFERLWSYYRNPMRERASASGGAGGDDAGRGPSSKPYHLAQEAGLPPRLRGVRAAGALEDPVAEKEIVIENDIAWRLDALADFAFGRPARIVSAARRAEDRAAIERILDAAWEASGGAPLVQDMALLGMVHGHIDLLLRAEALFAGADGPEASAGSGAARSGGPARAAGGAAIGHALDAARRLRVELVEAPRAVPFLNPGDYRRIDAYIIRTERETPAVERDGFSRRVLGAFRGGAAFSASALTSRRGRAEVVEILSAHRRLVRRDGATVHAAENPLGVLPVVHIQNASQPFRYEGLSDVEPLIPLQDELNTRLSDRAHRVTMQSFNMYLVKGFDLPDSPGARGGAAVGPGRIWSTDNPDASIHAFGGDGHSPSEEAHIEQIRDAMDKTSAVSPVVIGVIRERLGHLSSENALRVTLSGVLNKAARRRLAYGRGIAAMCRLILLALDRAGVFRTDEADRGVRLEWPDPLPADERERLAAARTKLDLGVPKDRVLAELGYGITDAGAG